MLFWRNFLGRKKSLFFILSVFAVFSLQNIFSLSGGFAGEKNIRIIKTEYFDIIYAQRSEKIAAILYENADSIFEETAALFDSVPSFRLPVVIIPSVENLNAFFTPIPYNHIVLYDTSSSSLDELSSFSENFLSIFRHELTHALTYNLKNKFWRGVGKIFGDAADLGFLSISPGLAEGAAVVSESFYGEGRLNNEFFKHIIRQSKIEDSFPSFYDVQGARDVYPVGSYYHFNAAFYEWLQKEYGMQMYAEFWYKIVNFQKLTIGSSFKSVYGISLKKAWKNFYNEYEIPAIPANPVSAEISEDFFEPRKNDYSILNREGSLYESLSYAGGKFFWFDYNTGKIQYAEISPYVKKPVVKNFVTVSTAEKIAVSCDGKFLAVSYFSSASSAVKAKVRVYDFNKKNYITLKGHGQKDASIIQSGSDYFLVCQNYKSPYSSIEIYKIIFSSSGNLKSLEKYNEITFDINVFPSGFVQCGEGYFAFIKKDKMKYSICVYDVNGNKISEYKMPYEDMILENLSYSENDDLVFNYVQKNTMPRYGIVSMQTGDFLLCEEDFSGGIFYPQKINDNIYYIGKFYNENRILKLKENKLTNVSKFVADDTIDFFSNNDVVNLNDEILKNDSDSLMPEFSSEKFNGMKYLAKGIFIPISIYSSSSFGINYGLSYPEQNFPLGITHITGLPWTDFSNSLAVFSAGYGIFSNAFGFDLQLKSGTDTQLLNSLLELKFEADKYGPKQLAAIHSLSSVIPFGNISYISLGNTFSAYYGKQDDFSALKKSAQNTSNTSDGTLFTGERNSCIVGITSPANDTFYNQFQEVFSVTYSNVHKAGASRFNKLGFSLGTGFGYYFSENLESKKTLMNSSALTAVASFSLPKILPFSCYQGFVYNLPVTLSGSIFPSSSNYAGSSVSSSYMGTSVFDFDAQIILLGYEVQKSLPLISALYMNNMYLAAGYTSTVASYMNTKRGFQPQFLGEYFGGLKDGSSLYLDSFYVSMNLGFTPNYGILTNKNLKMELFGKLYVSLHKSEFQKTDFTFSLGINSSF